MGTSTLTAKDIALGAASVALIGVLAYGKYKLAVAKPLWWVILLGGLVFAISTPARAE